MDSFAVKHKVERAGVIPVAYTNPNTLIMCMGIDAKSGDMSDFGGKVELGEDKPSTAVRELAEESLGFFRLSNEYLLDNMLHMGTCGFCTVYFVLVSLPELLHFPKQFARELLLANDSEMLAVKLLFPCDVDRACENEQVYYVVASILKEFIKGK